MMNITGLFKRMALGLLMAAVPLVGGCSDDMLTWTEEVKLLDGRVITVTQKRRIEENIEREAWLTIKLPELGGKEIVWHENLQTMLLNVYQGRLYVVGKFPTEREVRLYGWPIPAYVGFRYDNGQWRRIQFNEIPEAIYDANMYPENMVLARLKHVSVADKVEIFKDDRWRDHQRKIDPHYVIPR